MTPPPQHHFLTISEFHLSPSDAKNAAMRLLKQIGQVPIAEKWENLEIKLNRKGVEEIWPFGRIVKELQSHGVIESIQSLLDASDKIFGWSITMATTSSALDLTGNFYGTSVRKKGPGRLAPIEPELAGDILFFRTEACQYSGEPDFARTTRSFRAYLAAAITLVEAFLNKHIPLQEARGLQAEAKKLGSCYRLEEKIEVWVNQFTKARWSEVTSKPSWTHFRQLQKLRNEMMHGASAFSAYRILDLAKELNYVKLGVGELLKHLRSLQGLPTLMFIERVRTAPAVRFQPRIP